MNKYITYLFLLLLSCGKPQDNNGIFTMDLSKDDLPKTTVSLDDYTTKWTRIDLETTEDCLLDPSFNIYPTDHLLSLIPLIESSYSTIQDILSARSPISEKVPTNMVFYSTVQSILRVNNLSS